MDLRRHSPVILVTSLSLGALLGGCAKVHQKPLAPVPDSKPPITKKGCPHRFILTGSRARKLKRGGANLLPGRIIMETLDPLSFWELGAHFRL